MENAKNLVFGKMGRFLARFLAHFWQNIFIRKEWFLQDFGQNFFCGIVSGKMYWIVWNLPKKCQKQVKKCPKFSFGRNERILGKFLAYAK